MGPALVPHTALLDPDAGDRGAGDRGRRATGLREVDAAGRLGRASRVTCGMGVVRPDRRRPGSLWSAVAAALGPRPRSGATPLTSPEDGDHIVSHLTGRQGVSEPVAVVLDHLEALSNAESRRSVAAFAKAVPAGWTLALASREEVPLPVARMRIEGHLLEIGADDLALSGAQASRLLAAVGVELSDARAARLAWDTEGWPAALHLAALALEAGEAVGDRPFTGTERSMVDYLRSEVLDPLSKAQRRFLVRTSILDRVSGSLGDAVLDGTGSTQMLEKLQRRNLLVLPDDGEGEWYRYHRLLRQELQAELRSAPPDLVQELHARAAAWFEEHGESEDAIDHAYLAGDQALFGRLVLGAMQPIWASGQIDTVEGWMERLGSRSPAPHTPAMIAHGALIFALLGRPGDCERWAAVAESLPATGTLPDGSTVEGDAGLPAGEPVPARPGHDAPRRGRSAGGARPDQSLPRHDAPHRGPRRICSRATSTEPTRRSPMPTTSPRASRRSPVAALVLAEQVLIAVEREEWTAAESLVKRALEVVDPRPVRRLLDQCPGLRLRRTGGGTSRGHARGARARSARRTPASAAHLRAARRLGPGAGRAGPGLPGSGRPGGCPRRARAGARHPAAAP